MKKTVSLILCFTMLIACVSMIVNPSTVAHAATRQELEDEIDRLDDEISKNKKQLNELADKKEEQQKYLDTLESQITAVEKKVSNLQTQIDAIDKEIEGYNNQLKQLSNEIELIQEEINTAAAEITATKAKIDSSKDLLSTKLRTSYINGKTSTLKILMGSDSLASFLTRLEMMKRMSEDDKRVIDEFKDQVEKLNKAKKELENKKDELDEKHKNVEETKALSVEKKKELTTKQAEYDSSISQLESDYSKVEKFISDLDRNSAIYKSYVERLQSERAAADKEIDELIKNYNATTQPTTTGTTLYASNSDTTAATTSAGGASHTPGATGPAYACNDTWAWPLGSASCYISSPYGNRSASISGWSFHGGVHITGGGIYGKPVYASRGGTVIAAVWGETGYGRYVVIDHADGFTTVYGHCSSLSVTTGQTVSKGQQIANVGSTGNSTGPHLHFEIRYNGAKQNPMNYVKKP